MRRRAPEQQQQDRSLNERLSLSVTERESRNRYQDPGSKLFVHNTLQGGRVISIPIEAGDPALYQESSGYKMLGVFDQTIHLRSKDPNRLYLIAAMFRADFVRFNELLDKVFHPKVTQKKGSPLEIVTLLAAELIVINPRFMEALLKNDKVQLHPQALNIAYSRVQEANQPSAQEAESPDSLDGFDKLLKHYLTQPMRYVNGEKPQLPVNRSYIQDVLGEQLSDMYLEAPHKTLYACLRVGGAVAALPIFGVTTLAIAGAAGTGLVWFSSEPVKCKVEYTLKTDLKVVGNIMSDGAHKFVEMVQGCKQNRRPTGSEALAPNPRQPTHAAAYSGEGAEVEGYSR